MNGVDLMLLAAYVLMVLAVANGWKPAVIVWNRLFGLANFAQTKQLPYASRKQDNMMDEIGDKYDDES